MKFRSRYSGELVLTKGQIKTRRSIERGETVSFGAKTVDLFGADLKALAKAGRLAPLDDEARGLLGLPPIEQKPAESPPVAEQSEPEPVLAPEPAEEPAEQPVKRRR